MQCFHTKDKHLESLLGSMTNKIWNGSRLELL
jgi:hypothetical protein